MFQRYILLPSMMETVRTSETSVNFNLTTRRYIPEDSKLHTRRRENLKSRIGYNVLPCLVTTGILVNEADITLGLGIYCTY
jgi:hypothetical protein